jgi:hypothetical protein
VPSLGMQGQNGIRGPRIIVEKRRRSAPVREEAGQRLAVPARSTRAPVEPPVAVLAAKRPQQHGAKYQVNHALTVGSVYIFTSTARARVFDARVPLSC